MTVETEDTPESGANSTLTTDGLTIVSYNIRYALLDTGVLSWSNRRDRVATVLQGIQPGAVAIQECWLGQLEDLSDRLPTYEWVSSPDRNGEHTPIGYRPDRFEIVEGGGFGLAPDGKRSVAAWDAALPRTVTHATLRERSSKQQFTLYSVHLDHVGTEARRESARMILDRLPEGPVVVAGDFNCKPGSEPYEILTAELADAFEVAQIRAGPSETYTGFGDPTVDATDTPEAKRIDHALVRDISVHSHRTVSHNLDGFPPSDHRPVALEVSLQGDAPGSGS